MEIIRISGYTENEKMNIASKYLLPKQLTENGIKGKEIKISDSKLKVLLDTLLESPE